MGFLATRESALALTHAAINALADFYEEDFGQRGPTLLPERRRLFCAFIGMQG